MSFLAYVSRTAVCGLSVLKDGSDNHYTPGFQRIILKGIDDCLLSLRQQIQHDVVIILMVLGCPGEISYGVAILAMKRRLSGVINGSLENLKAVITHGQADSRERR